MTGMEDIVLVSAASPATITLPSNVPTGYVCEVKDTSGNASVNNITIAGTIDGATNYVINTNYGYKTILYNGTSWYSV